jgi:uncharacterized protein YdeI (YjbR/CyaY-like superfamily)
MIMRYTPPAQCAAKPSSHLWIVLGRGMPELRSGLPILSFADQGALERWLAKQPRDSKGAWVRFSKKGSGIASVTKDEAIDSALCYGWIDGQLRTYDAKSWLVRFTPRGPRSTWSQLNRKRALGLISAGRMQAPGQLEIDKAKADGRWKAAYAPASEAEVPPDLQSALDANPKAAAFFATLTGANRYAILHRIGAVKKAETRARKIADFVRMLERGETVHG